MKILAFESTAKVASVALTEDERLLALYQSDSGRTQSEVLLPMAEHILKTHGLTVDDLDLLAVTQGPGSFTGVRIGVATVKGLACGKNIPCVGVSTLHALAENLRHMRGMVCAVMDARRSQVYTALFRADGETVQRITQDSAMAIEELLDSLASYKEPIYFAGDGYLPVTQEARRVGFAFTPTPILLRDENAYACACVAYRMHQDGQSVCDRDLRATYLRLPQAERERLEQLKAKNQNQASDIAEK